MMSDEFGVFLPVFAPVNGCLSLLHLNACAPHTIALIRQCCRATSDPRPDVHRLLDAVDWRTTLVAVVATLLIPNNTETTRRLWIRFDSGSWVTPQIAVALALIDPEFVTHALRRLELLCPPGPFEHSSASAI